MTTNRKSFADLRGDMIATIDAIRRGEIPTTTGAVIFAGYKEINANIQAEINAAKMAMATEGKAHQFGRVVGMGKRLINGNDDSSEGGTPDVPALR